MWFLGGVPLSCQSCNLHLELCHMLYQGLVVRVIQSVQVSKK